MEPGPNTPEELDFGLDINLPFSEDGQHVHMAAYRIVALVTHQGMDHHTGHYQSLLLMDNAIWLADDDQYPALTQQHRKDVLQLWLVKEPEDELAPDTQADYQAPPSKKQRQSHETMTLLFGNVTHFGTIGCGRVLMPCSSFTKLTWESQPPRRPSSTTPTRAGR